MNDTQDNNDRDCDGYHSPLIRTHVEQLELFVVVTVCIGLIVAVASVPHLDSTGAHAEAAVLALAVVTLGVLLGMLIHRLLKDFPNGEDDF